MRMSLVIGMAAGLLLLPYAAGAQDYGSQDVQTDNAPPVAQPLVREGDFAIKLAARYNLGSPENEAEAENLLASAGVLPRNGWISDYPVTPEILGQIGESAEQAAREGSLSLAPEEATRLLVELAQELNLPVPAGRDAEAAEEQKARPEQAVVEGYYTGYGPPIITYYPPPPAYLYLYAWVPYPVWWYGFWYPGFYITHTFTTTIVVDSRTVFVRNRYVDPVTRQVVRIDPVVRSGGTVRSATVLRTEDGRAYGTVREMRRAHASGPVRDSGTGVTSRRPPGDGGFRSQQDRRSAQELYQRSIERQGSVGDHGPRSGGRDVRGEQRRRTMQQEVPGGPVTVQPPRNERSYEDRRRSGPGSKAPQGLSGGAYKDTDKGKVRQFQSTTPGSSGRSAAPGPVVKTPAAPRKSQQQTYGGTEERPVRGPAVPSGGDRSFSVPGGNDQGLSNPRGSRGLRDDDESSSGRGRSWRR